MLRNYLKIAYRNLFRNKVTSTINIVGLSLGMTVVLLIGLYIHHEKSYDQWMEGKDNIYRVFRDWGDDSNTVWTPGPLAKKLATDFPEVIASSGLGLNGETMVEYRNDKLYVEEVAFIDSTFFETMLLPFKYGNPRLAMNKPEGMVVSSKLSDRLFGEINPIGEVVKLNGEEEYTITGVLDLENKNTHLNYDLYFQFNWDAPNWTGNNRATYIRIQPEASVENLQAKINVEVNKMLELEYLANNFQTTPEDYPEWRLQPVADIHLHSSNFSWIADNEGSMRHIYIFFVIAILVLAVAVVNYVNLSTAQATKRTKEIGVRKTTGARRTQLTAQFLTETLFQSFIAMIVALLLTEILLPVFNNIIDRELHFFGENIKWMILPAIGVAILIGALAGTYPALVMSAFSPVSALKSSFLKTSEKGIFRKVLVSGQFTITIALLVVMAFVYRQVNYMMEHDLGFHPDQVMVIPMNFNDSHRKVESLRSELLNIPGIESISTASKLPGQHLPDWGMLMEGKDEDMNPNVIFADENYAQTIGIEMKKGRFLQTDISADTINNFVVNESFVERYNIENPVGTKVKFSFEKEYGQIIGVMKNFHFNGLNRSIRPLIINGQHNRWYASINLATNNIASTVASIENLWAKVEPKHPMRFSFLDEDFNKQYAEQQRFGDTILYATLLTLFIAMLGLFGLAAFSVERRTKEIGVRKVLGATTAGIVGLLSKDFLKLVLIAVVIAVPVGWYFSNLWLEDFAFRTNLTWWVFALAGMSAIIVAFLTVGFQSMKAALANPVKSLRSE